MKDSHHAFRTIGYNFSAFKIRGTRIYMTGQVFNLLGDWMQQTAQAWLVWELSQKATALGIVAFFQIRARIVRLL